MRDSAGTRCLAALPHLGYLPVAFAVGLAVLQPNLALSALVFSVVWTAFSLLVFRTEPKSQFLREHLHQARSYHRLGVVMAISALTFVTYVAVFTWGIGAILAVFLAPVAIVAWMIPTWKAAYHALQGEPHLYEAVSWSHGEQPSLALTA